VEVEDGVDAVAGQRLHGLLDRVDVGGVENAGLGFHTGPDDAQSDNVETVGRQERRVVIAEPGGGRLERRLLVHLVEPVQEDDLSVTVGQPRAGGREGQ
jgi:hypothetical protein